MHSTQKSAVQPSSSSAASLPTRQDPPPAPTGSFCGRPVVVGTVPFDERLRKQRISEFASVVSAGVGAAVAHWQNWGTEGAEALENHGVVDIRGEGAAAQGLGLVAGLVAGYATKRLVIGLGNAAVHGYDWFQAKLGKATPQQQLDQVVAQAVKAGPLTLEGTRHALARIKTLQDTFRMPAGEILRAIAKLGAAIPTEAERGLCGRDSTQPLKHLTLLTDAMREARGAGADASEHKDALAVLGGQLRPRKGTTDKVREDLARHLGTVYAGLTPYGDSKEATSRLSTLEDRVKFLAGMRSAPLFGEHSALQVMSTSLECSYALFDVSRPKPVLHTHSNAGAPLREVEAKQKVDAFLKSVATLPTTEAQATRLDRLVDELCRFNRGGLSLTTFSALNGYLSEQAEAPSPLREAAVRAKLLVNHWLDGRETSESKGHGASPMRELGLQNNSDQTGEAWKSAPCSLLEHLAFLASQSRGDTKLQKLASEACSNARITANLKAAPLDMLRLEATAALGVVEHRGDGGSGAAEAYLQIFETLAARDDLPPGMFITGLLPEHSVEGLRHAIGYEIFQANAASESNRAAELTNLSAKLSTLSQMHGEALTDAPRNEQRTVSFQNWLLSIQGVPGQKGFIAVPLKDGKH